MSRLSKINNPDTKNQFKLVDDPNSQKVIDLLIKKLIPVTLYKNLLTIRDTDKEFLSQDLFKKMINNKYNVDVARVSAEKKLYDFGKEMHFDVKAPGNKSDEDRSFIRLFEFLAVMASGIATMFSSSDLKELCDRIKLILQEKQAGKNSDMIKDEFIAIADKLLEYKCISTKQCKQFFSNVMYFKEKK